VNKILVVNMFGLSVQYAIKEELVKKSSSHLDEESE
jgi:hypothetical protein